MSTHVYYIPNESKTVGNWFLAVRPDNGTLVPHYIITRSMGRISLLTWGIHMRLK